MRAINYWEQFLSTGRIKDYLSYREKEAEDQPAGEAAEETESGSRKEGRGEGSDQCYRDGIKNRACW